VKGNVDVFGVSMVLVLLCEHDGGLIVRKQGRGIKLNTKELRDDGSKPKLCRLS